MFNSFIAITIKAWTFLNKYYDPMLKIKNYFETIHGVEVSLWNDQMLNRQYFGISKFRILN